MRIAAIIPAHNEAWNIRRIIYNLLYVQNYGSNWLEKIIVVCSGCTDGTDEIVKDVAAKSEKVCPIIERERRGKTHALNMALRVIDKEAGSAEVVVFLSGDVIPRRTSISSLASALEDPSIGCAISNPVPLNDKKKRSGKLVDILWNLHNEMNSYGWHKVTGEMFAVRRTVLEEMPDHVINDDLYIEYLVHKSGLRFAYVPSAIVYMWGPESLVELLEQRRRVNLGHLQIAKSYKVQHSSVRNTAKLVKTLVLRYSFLDAAFFGLMEGFSRLFARIDNLKGVRTPIWKMIESSKGGVE